MAEGPDPDISALQVPPFNRDDLDFSVPFARVWIRLKRLAESNGIVLESSLMDAEAERSLQRDGEADQKEDADLASTIMTLKQRLTVARAMVLNVPGIGLSQQEQGDMLEDFHDILEEKRGQLQSYLALPIFDKLGLKRHENNEHPC
ncbi:hypothetical protein M427DRAFT_54024 [Gonapodya prolifera JEL478]|uniref:Mediator of RNA polymerase II transcription subunit 9 n=1 Tax=Gonapodya prolifera (strain JEL478) TaxID=1344416 RepID=A0A139AN77_GONPJ|nr:hypothetical protein M427DRAFT_54024 [Gonapodya prolifera JEL478]|eukprot:KXS18196.1 hypothetical protein M427DRAFT_54024 [Gonapodya prolifera JEL478]